jgi:hypothetical protein
MIGQTVPQYSSLWNPACSRNSRTRDKILDRVDGGGAGEACDLRLAHSVVPEFPHFSPSDNFQFSNDPSKKRKLVLPSIIAKASGQEYA